MDMFSALAEPTRRSILEVLVTSGQMSATDIYNKFHSSPQAVSQHLKVLRDTQLVTVEKKAQQRIYRVNIDGMYELEHWVKKFTKQLDKRFEMLDRILEVEKKRLKKRG